MAEIPDVVLGEEIQIEWGNAIRDRTVQRYADEATRDSEHSSPDEGDYAFMEDTGDTDVYYSGAWRHVGVPAGMMMDWPGIAAPTGWLVCDGSIVSRTTYAGIFAAIGDVWGVGDGSTTFALPDFRGRYARGKAASGDGDAIGEYFGSDLMLDHTHPVDPPSTTTSSDSHSHTNPTTANNGTPVLGAQDSASSGGRAYLYGSPAAGQASSWHVHDQLHSHTQGSTGSDAHSHTVNIASFNSGAVNGTNPSQLPASAAVLKVIKI